MILKPTKKKKKFSKRDYYQYIQSQQWRDKREMAFVFYGRHCSFCSSNLDLQVHHRHYKNFGHERIEDLQILCESCHRTYHKKQIWKNGKKSKYMKDPNYDTSTVTYYPKRKIN